MSHYYFDSSALVKRYVIEDGTDWVQVLCRDEANTVYTARNSAAEIVAAFFLRARTGSISADTAQNVVRQFKIDIQSQYQIVEITESVVNSAMDLAEKHGLRGYDSVQLAAALALQHVRAALSLSPIVFVCADDQLNSAADAVGLRFENPNRY